MHKLQTIADKSYLSQDSVHGIHKGHSEDSGGVRVQADVEDVAVSVVASELSHQAVHHQVPVGEGGDASLEAAGVV